MIAKNDEVLLGDQSGRVRQTVRICHALSDFDDDLPEILEFLQLA
ncbi:hypothetical protein [Limnohabitans planktonicus]|nr:hypothetical protein [Limnohabitans planktonicus]